MAYGRQTQNRVFLARVGMLIVACTAALTLSFFGLMAFAAGGSTGFEHRVPLYVLAMSLAFVAGIVGLDKGRRDGRSILVYSVVVAGATFTFLLLGGEGALYAVRNPDQALASRRVLYLIAAGLMATGLGYWGLRHWRDVSSTGR